jgi:hypothetical protein
MMARAALVEGPQTTGKNSTVCYTRLKKAGGFGQKKATSRTSCSAAGEILAPGGFVYRDACRYRIFAASK